MLKKRIIPLLLILDDRFVKTINFNSFKDVGDPISTAKIFNDSDADELILLNINRDNKFLSKLIFFLKEISKECFIPITAGGGIKSIEDATKIIKNGADKIVINSACYENYSLIKNIAEKFGRQAVVASIDVKKVDGNLKLVSNCGKKIEKISLENHLKKLMDNDIGEVKINSIDCEGTMKGPDYELAQKVNDLTTVPIIFSGGIGNYDQIKNIFQNSNISAVACGSLFNFTDSNPIRAKAYLKSYNINLRLF